MKKLSDGWHTICGRSVYVEDGYILRAMKANDTLPASVYKKSPYGRWDKACPCTVSAFRSGHRRGTYAVM